MLTVFKKTINKLINVALCCFRLFSLFDFSFKIFILQSQKSDFIFFHFYFIAAADHHYY